VSVPGWGEFPPRNLKNLGREPMKKILMGLTAVFALSVAVPAYAGEEKKEEAKKEEAAKPAKKGKKAAKEEAPKEEAKK
jgi:hypothetical protein